MEDPLTGDFPSRNELEEEEEEALAAELPAQYTISPQIERGAQIQSHRDLVVLIGPTACFVAAAVFASAEHAGTITVPELQRLKSPIWAEEHGGQKRTLLHKSSLIHANGNCNIICCKRALPPEQAKTWAHAVINTLDPARVLVASSLLAMDYRGPGDAANEDLVFELPNSTWEASSGSLRKHDLLPPGTLVTGVPAALVQEMEGGGRPAVAFLVVENSPVPRTGQVIKLADALCDGLGVPKLDVLGKATVTDLVEQMYRTSASNSMFI